MARGKKAQEMSLQESRERGQSIVSEDDPVPQGGWGRWERALWLPEHLGTLQDNHPGAHELCAQSSPALRPHRLEPARLLCPWDPPGENTAVGAISPSWGSSRPGDRAWASCIGRRVLHHRAAREAPFLNSASLPREWLLPSFPSMTPPGVQARECPGWNVKLGFLHRGRGETEKEAVTPGGVGAVLTSKGQTYDACLGLCKKSRSGHPPTESWMFIESP